jgi:hypothetical protein
MAILLRRADQRIPDHGTHAEPCTWDYAKHTPKGSMFEHDLALVTCANGHTLRLTSRVHSIETDGTVKPSWVCTRTGCTWHVMIKLEGYKAP